jgi:type I restriction enzyme S subunit
VRVPLADVIQFNPRPPKGVLADDSEVSFVPMAAVEAGSGRIDASMVRTCGEVKKGFTYFAEGDVLFAKITPCMENGKSCVAKGLRNGVGFGSTEFHVLRPNADIDARYLYHFVADAKFRREAAHHMTGAVGQKRVPVDFLRSAEIPLPALSEQRLIVAEIEKQFSRLDEAVANLRRVKQRLLGYKQSVLEAAIAGRLGGSDLVESVPRGVRGSTGAAFEESICRDRRTNWPKGTKFKEPAQPDQTLNLTVPGHWAKLSWEAVLAPGEGSFKRGPFGSALTKAMFVSSGYKVYEQYCPINDDCSFVRYYITPQKFEEMKGFAVQAGDFLISCSGVTLGRITRVPDRFEPGVINQALLRVRLNEAVMDPQFFLVVFRSPRFQSFIFDRSAGAAIPNVRGVSDLKAIPVPVPPLAEQHRIVAEVDRRLSIARGVEAQVDANLQRAQALRQAILAKAFGGAAADR